MSLFIMGKRMVKVTLLLENWDPQILLFYDACF